MIRSSFPSSAERLELKVCVRSQREDQRRLRNGVFGASRFEQTCFPVRCDFSGRIGVVGLRYAIAEPLLKLL